MLPVIRNRMGAQKDTRPAAEEPDMHILTARQCPLCVLRFGSSSELDQHLRVDHQPPRKQPERPRQATEAQVEHEHRPAAERMPTASRFVVSAVVAGALIAVIAAISWHVAALMSLAFAAAAAVRAATKTDTNR